MAYLDYITCLRYTLLVQNPRIVLLMSYNLLTSCLSFVSEEMKTYQTFTIRQLLFHVKPHTHKTCKNQTSLLFPETTPTRPAKIRHLYSFLKLHLQDLQNQTSLLFPETTPTRPAKIRHLYSFLKLHLQDLQKSDISTLS